jgi:hypothetical protein
MSQYGFKLDSAARFAINAEPKAPGQIGRIDTETWPSG